MEAHLFVKNLAKQGMDFYVGVPDSLLKSFCAYLQDHVAPKNHIITANEGNAIGMAVGHYLATFAPAVVYMQNSGLGNTINPLASLADKEVYQIPMLLVIGWRGEPGIKDEPQHIKQGRITPEQLSLLEIPYLIVDEESEEDQVARWAVEQLITTQAPVALLIRSGSFTDYKSQARHALEGLTLLREQALSTLLDLTAGAAIVATTGKTSRELFELRAKRLEAQRDFLTVGGMGHTASIALGIALAKPNQQVVCIDGDGSLLMHLGAMPIIGSLSPCNFIHVLLNNAAHDSVGGNLL
nr:phosphonopyruvate decarboxylase [Paenalcaligenes hominis]